MRVLEDHEWLYVAIPIAMAITGYLAHSLTVAALFRPVRFVGVGPLGWQGLLPAMAARIAPRLFDSLIDRVGTIRDVYQAMDPDRIAEHLVLSVRPRTAEFVEDVMLDADPQLWDELSPDVKADVAERIQKSLPTVIPAVTADIDRKLDDLVDVDHLVRVRLVDDAAMLNRLFATAGRREFGFLRKAGLPIGLIAGILTLAEFTVWPDWIELPLVGALTFAIGDAVAVTILLGIPIAAFGSTVRYGLLGADQERVSRVGTRVVTREILTVRSLVTDILNGPRGDLLRALVSEHVAPMIDDAIEYARPTFREARTDEQIADLASRLADHTIDVALEPLSDPAFSRERQVVLEDVFLNRMLDLSAEEFVGLIRPALHRAEWLLVLVGAATGVLTGLVLAFWVF
ncbi:hypothetical protein FOS14_09590 [Skermania sp. ID1734]|uniref:hypothetical protein n=1 Tax=Skermania sp. ID1734 TaxID=2597516 RepID=UPI00117F365F|nr:hypothetical protein [Skermania sp. ID1734]TSE00059.1 hypothetical protein FOS14_09590 [Skermania sp. ID1734]